LVFVSVGFDEITAATAPVAASVTSLHNRVHVVVTSRQRDDGSWGTPLETALGAVALAVHPSRAPDRAERAVDRLQRWLADDELARSSADTAALALGARAAAVVQRRTYELTTAATTRVTELVAREERVIPTLHLVFCAWGLARVLPDRQTTPWPALGDRLRRAPRDRLGDALAAVGEGLVRGSFDGLLLRRVISAVASAPTLPDLTLLVWLEDVTLTEASRSGISAHDSGLAFLVQALAAGIDQLDAETTEATFIEPDLPDFDPDADLAVQAERLSQFEALLLDGVLGPRSAQGSVLAPEQTQAFIAHETSRFRARARRIYAAAIAGVGSVSAVVAALLLRQAADEPWRRWSGVLVAGVLLSVLGALFALYRDRRNRISVEMLGLTGVAAAVAILATVDQFRKHPSIANPQFVFGIVIGTMVPLLVMAVASRWREPKNTGARP
jgi:hypothetical protein